MMKTSLENQFFGHQKLLHLLRRRVVDLKEGYRQNMALIGNRFVGKTAILHKFMEELDEESIIILYLDLDHKDINHFFARFLGGFLYEFCRIQRLPLFNDISLLMENARKLIPQTVEEIKRIQTNLSKHKYEEAYRQIISLPEVLTGESGQFCVIVLDEFQNLEELGVSDVFQELGKRIMTQKRCIYVVASSQGAVAKKILAEKLSLLFGNFEILDVEPLDSKTSQELISAHLKEIQISQPLRDFLADFTGGYPLYLNVIVRELLHLSSIHQQREIFLPLLTQAIENVLFYPWGILNRHFEMTVGPLCSSKSNWAMSSVLIALTEGKHRLREAAQQAGLKPQMINQRLNRLMELGLIGKNGQTFYFPDKLLKYWLKGIFQRRLKALDLLSHQIRTEFQEELTHLVVNFQITSKRDLPSRVTELLYCFDNEAVCLNGRRYKLPIFREVIHLPKNDSFGTGFEILKASSPEGTWFIGLKKENLCENDVHLFSLESKKLKERPQGQVLISLSDLDENTRIKALQERMWIWNEKEINALLSFYDKPFII